MHYLAPVSRSATSDVRFSSRAIPGRMQGPVSKLDLQAFPDERQVAYDIYKQNIDVHLAATLAQKRVSATADTIVMPPVKITFPLPLPRVVMSFNLKPEYLRVALATLRAKCGPVTEVEGIAKHPNAFVIENPDPNTIFLLAPKAIDPPFVAGACSPEGLRAILSVYEMVELYMRTNTYPAFKGNETDEAARRPRCDMERATTVGAVAESMRSIIETKMRGDVSMEFTVEQEGSKKKQVVEENGAWFGKDSDYHKTVQLPMGNHVSYHAAPSPAKDSSTSFGNPTSVPAMPGMLFPWFDGMNTGDVSYLRTMASRLFFRCFGKDPRTAYLRFRTHVGEVGAQRTGIILAHMLRGIEISLDSQGRFYALFDGSTYLGFVILGARWRLRFEGVWHIPVAATVLSEQLQVIKGHSGSLKAIGEILLADHGLIVNEEDIDSAVKLAGVLSGLVWSGEDVDVKEKKKTIEVEVGRLDFGKKVVGIGAHSIAAALKAISDPAVDISDQYVYFPRSEDYKKLGSRIGLVMSRFGSKAPSFAISKGEEKVFVGKGVFDKGDAKLLKAAEEMKSVIVTEKPLHLAILDMETFLKDSPYVFGASKERASPYRNHVFSNHGKVNAREMIVNAAAEVAKDVSVIAVAKRKRGVDEIAAPVADDDSFFKTLEDNMGRISRAGSVAL